ncbi:MAG TPA: nucleotidyltransferase family protein [Thermoanaerobaculia bacterium]|nr:nucleotidyltransferase family protein [Thermoanaerobaculia bacterium]
MPRIVTGGSFMETIKEASRFFMKTDDVHDALARVTRRLAEEGIDYALIGGMALVAHGFVRFTSDVDILITPEGLRAIHERLVGRGYVPLFPGARKALRDTVNGTKVEFITAGEYPGDGKPKPVRFPDPAEASLDMQGTRVITLEKLIELKLASGLSNRDRLRDLADVQDLIRALELPLDLAERLDPSVRDTYVEYWHAIQNAQGPDRE